MKTKFHGFQKSLLVLMIAASLILPISVNAQQVIIPNAPGPFKIFVPYAHKSGQVQQPPQSTPTPKPSPTPTPIITTIPGKSYTYYLSPSGNDSNSGQSESQAWATFDRALNSNTSGNKLKPGDTLILLDGTYRQSLSPLYVGGQPNNLITIRAKNDGKAIIDGEGVRIPVNLEGWKGASYFDVEGIIAENSSGSVYYVTADNNIFRRVSGYNANTNDNQHVFLIWSNNNLVEDCIAAGSGRKMFLVYSSANSNGQNNTVRRCFAYYRDWEGRDWHDTWPENSNFSVYSGDYNTLENNIAYGNYISHGFRLLSNGPTDDNIGNKILGSIAIFGGQDPDGGIVNWGNIRPQPTQWDLITDRSEPQMRVGFSLGHDGIIKDNLIQDVLSWGNASLGIGVELNPSMSNDRVNRATIINNGLDQIAGGITGIDAFQQNLARLTITNSRIDKIRSSSYPYQLVSPITGEGARLTYQYLNGILKDGSDGQAPVPLWPWPMEQRIRNELGISVTNLVANITRQAQLATPTPYSADTTNKYPGAFLSVSPTIIPFGNVKLGTNGTNLITVKNLGNKPLTISNYQLTDMSSNVFSIVSGGTCPQVPYTLSPSQNCTLKVAFSPQNYQAQSATINFISPDVAPYPLKANTYLSGIGYGTTSNIPIQGKIEAEAYTNSSGTFQINPTIDNNGSGKISEITSGAWLTYPVNVTQSGNYKITARVASINNGGNTVNFSLDLDGTLLGTFYPPNTGNWDSFTDYQGPTVFLSQGNHTLKINLATGGFDINFLNFTLQ